MHLVFDHPNHLELTRVLSYAAVALLSGSENYKQQGIGQQISVKIVNPLLDAFG